jgi:hypothetical protein
MPLAAVSKRVHSQPFLDFTTIIEFIHYPDVLLIEKCVLAFKPGFKCLILYCPKFIRYDPFLCSDHYRERKNCPYAAALPQ